MALILFTYLFIYLSMYLFFFFFTFPGHLPSVTLVFPTAFIANPHIFAKSLPTSISQFTLISDPMYFISLHYCLNDIAQCA